MIWFCIGVFVLIAALFFAWVLCALAGQIDDELGER